SSTPYHSVTAAVCIFDAEGGDPKEAMAGGVNIGDDTATVAIIAGSMAGALRGFAAVPKDLYEHLERANALHLTDVARGLAAVAQRGQTARAGTEERR